MSNAMPRLIARSGLQPGQEFPLGNRPLTLGRDAGNDIALDNAEVSRRHARLTPHQGSYLLEDLGSTNGTFVNGRPLNAPVLLRHGDVIEFGETASVRLVLGDAPVMPPPIGEAYATAPTVIEGVLPPLGPEVVVEADAPAESGRRRWLLGCGCAALMMVFICATAVFLLDRYAPDVLYEPLLPIFDLLGL